MAITKKNTTKERPNVAKEVTDAFIAQLEKGVAPWHKPWAATGNQMPNKLSGEGPYRGVNSFILGISSLVNGYESPWWGTYKQITELGGQVRKGEKSTTITFYKTFDKDNDTENSEAGEDATKKKRFMLWNYNVFNATQADGLPEKYLSFEKDERTEVERIAACEAAAARYLDNGGPSLNHNGGDRAFYVPSQDIVAMPTLSSFESSEEYYSTLFHELAHSTGHSSRLGREGVIEGHGFGSTRYSREELIAEMGSAMACAALGIDQTVTLPNSINYFANWAGALRADPSLILAAAAGGQKAAECIGVLSLAQTAEIGEEETPELATEVVPVIGRGTLNERKEAIRNLENYVKWVATDSPEAFAQRLLDDEIIRLRGILKVVDPADIADVSRQIVECETISDIIKGDSNNARVFLAQDTVIQKAQELHADDPMKLAAEIEGLSNYQAALSEALLSDPEPWQDAVLEEYGEEARPALLNLVEWRGINKVTDKITPFGGETLTDEQEDSREKILEQLAELSRKEERLISTSEFVAI